METSSFQYDLAFIEGIHRGDRWCFELMYRLTIDNIKRYVSGKSNDYLTAEEREDLISEAYYHVFKQRAKIICFNDCGAFLTQGCWQLLIGCWRKSKSWKGWTSEFTYLHDVSEEPQEFDKEYYFNLLRGGVDKLRGRFKEVIILLFYEKKTMLEVCQQLEINRQTVLNIKNRAITKLINDLPHTVKERSGYLNRTTQ